MKPVEKMAEAIRNAPCERRVVEATINLAGEITHEEVVFEKSARTEAIAALAAILPELMQVRAALNRFEAGGVLEFDRKTKLVGLTFSEVEALCRACAALDKMLEGL